MTLNSETSWALDTLSTLIDAHNDLLWAKSNSGICREPHLRAAQYLNAAAADALETIEETLMGIEDTATPVEDTMNRESAQSASIDNIKSNPDDKYPINSFNPFADKNTTPLSVIDLIYREIERLISIYDPTHSGSSCVSGEFLMNSSAFLMCTITCSQWDDTISWIQEHKNCNIIVIYDDDDEWCFQWRAKTEKNLNSTTDEDTPF